MTRIAQILTIALWSTNASAYEVWMGTHLMTHTDATNLTTWSMAASKLDGININRAPHDTDPASNNDWRTIFAQLTNTKSTMSEIARSEVTRNPVKVDELAFDDIDQRLSEIFNQEGPFGYDLSILMFYDERGTYQGVEYLYEWTEIEVQHMRDWLDTNGHADVELMWNVRNNSQRNQDWAVDPLVDLVEIEASTTAFLANTNNQRTFFDWFWTNPATANKRIALQLPRVLPGDPLNQYKGTRRVAQSLGGSIGYGEDGMRSDRLIFLPVTYNDNYPYTPETVSNGAAYTNTLTSICLSLIEQRQLFEGRLAALPTVADADSTVRTAPPTITVIGDQVVSINSATPALPFSIADADTPVASLAVTATSSNEAVVPNSGIVLGGSGANRTVTITPASGQSGTSDITVSVSDGVWYADTTFTLTVGGLLLSTSSDASVKDNLTTVDLTNAATQLGAGGSSPFVDRCTVYVFQLPDLGAAADPFTGAAFHFNYESKDGALKNNDLYGLGRRDSAAVLGSDYYGQSTTSDPSDATRLQTDILTNGTPLGLVGTSSGGSAALMTYLNAQYASGAGIGKYVFLRLNTTAPKNGINRAYLTMSEGGVSNPTTDTRPRIAYTLQSGPGISGLYSTAIRQDTATVIPFTIQNLGATSLSVMATSSNTELLPNAGIVIGGSGANRTLTITPAAGKSGQTDITVEAGNGTDSVSVIFTLTVLRSLFSTTGDAEVQPTLTAPPYIISSQTSDTLLVGTAGGNVGKDRCVVFPFQLPDLGAVANPFYSASFTVNHASNQSAPLGNVSVYGLGSRGADEVLTDDYWSATAATDTTDATLLQTILVPEGSSDFGLKTTDANGSANLLAYLNAQYNGGAGIGQYVFLRLSADAAQSGGANRYVFTSANGAVTAGDNSIWPQINFLTNDGLQIPVVTMVALGSPVDLTAGSTWSDDLPAHSNASYVIPDTGNLRSETGTSTFPGFSLTVQAGGRFQVRGTEELGGVTTVDRLILNGGSSFAAGNYAELAAGTGNNVTNVFGGTITNSGYSRFLTYGTVGGSTIARSLKVLSLISGAGRIRAWEGSADGLSSVIIENPANEFFGTWESGPGSTLVFDNAGAVGTADIEVQPGGRLEIKGNWSASADLTVADAPGTVIQLGSYGWKVSYLFFGGSFLPDGVYSASDLNALGTNSVFTGIGTITVGAGLSGGPVAHWKLDEGSGTLAIDLSGGGKTGTLLHGAGWSSDATRASFVSFDGSDDRIATPFTYALSSSDSFSWAWWAKRTATGSSGAVMVGNRYPEGAPGENYEFLKFTPVEAQFANAESAGSIEIVNYADVPQDGWHHYAMVKTGTSYQWYVDGVAQGDPITLSYTEDSPIPFNIGGDDDDATPGGRESEHFEGCIDDVVLYDRALTPSEIQGVGNGIYVAPPTTALEDWRMLYFGTTENIGTAADDYDANFDGESNLLEFATGQSPHANTLAEISWTMDGANIEFRYTRSIAALADGIQFAVEWSDTLLPGTWSSMGVTDSPDPENPGDSVVQNRIATVPFGAAGRRFVRLKVTR